MAQIIKDYCLATKNALYVESLGQLRYLSALHHFDAVIGNSSSGILEAPSFDIPTINIGNRQIGREMSSSIVCVEPDAQKISHALNYIESKGFLAKLKHNSNPHDISNTSSSIVCQLHRFLNSPLSMQTSKVFCDQ